MVKDPRAEPDSTDTPDALDQAEQPEQKPEPRSTLVPSFDVETYARAVDVTQPRAPNVTITNEFELEEARRQSMKSSLPPARARAHSDAEISVSTEDVSLDDLRLSTPGELKPAAPPPARAPAPSSAVTPPAMAAVDPEIVLGDLKRVPKLLVPADSVPGLGLDHHAGFMLALVDSVLSYDTILDVCGMPRKEALVVLARLVEKKIVGV